MVLADAVIPRKKFHY